MLAKGHTQAAAKLMLHVAPLRATKDVPEHRLEEIRSGEQLDYFYVYGETGKLPDQLLDFSYEHRSPRACSTDARRSPGSRTGSGSASSFTRRYPGGTRSPRRSSSPRYSSRVVA